jgi:hypothetical protein
MASSMGRGGRAGAIDPASRMHDALHGPASSRPLRKHAARRQAGCVSHADVAASFAAINYRCHSSACFDRVLTKMSLLRPKCRRVPSPDNDGRLSEAAGSLMVGLAIRTGADHASAVFSRLAT